MSGTLPSTPTPGAGQGRTRIRRVTAIFVITFVVLAAVLSPLLWSYVVERQNTSHEAAPGLSTGLQALGLVESTLPDQTNQTWTLFSTIGIASAVPFTPWIIGGYGTNATNSSWSTLWACNELPLPSVWNASALPARTGNLSDGRAPFWQFMFVSGSGSGGLVFAIGSYTSGLVRVVGPLTQTDSCIEELGMGAGSSYPPEALPDLATNVAGPLAYKVVHRLDPQYASYSVIWTSGWALMANDGWGSAVYSFGAGWDADFYECDQEGVVPPASSIIAWHISIGLQNGTPTASAALGVEFNCTLPSYVLTAAEGGISDQGAAHLASVDLNVTGLMRGAYAPETQGLAAWMVDPEIFGSGGLPEGVSPDSCLQWVASPSACDAPASGWYAVLVSPSGSWLDSYGLIGGSPGWADPGVPIVTGETLEVLATTPVDGLSFGFSAETSSPSIQTNSVGL